VAMAEESMAGYRAIADLSGLARAAAVLGDALIDSGSPGGAVATLEAALKEIPKDDEVNRVPVLTNLARAHYRNNSPQLAVEAADEALPVAERHQLDRMIANLLANKAAGLAYVGRNREAVALMEGAVKVAQQGGYLDAELRARSNVTSIIWSDDLDAAFEQSKANLDLARRLGNRLMVNWIVAAQAPAAFQLGREWDEVLADIDDALEFGVEPFMEQHLLVDVAPLRASRRDSFDKLLARVTELTEQLEDPHTRYELAWVKAMADMHGGRPEQAADDVYEAATHIATIKSLYLGWAGRAAIWARDSTRLQAVIDALAADSDRSRMRRDDLLEFNAALAGLSGHPEEALAGYRAAISGRRELGVDFIAAIMALDQVIVLGPLNEAVRAEAGNARILFEALGAVAYVDRLDEAMRSKPATTPAVRQQRPSAAVPEPRA